MRTRDRDRQEEAPSAEPQATVSQAGDAGDDVIRRALSGDSQRFLAQNRQQGGE